jgi:hypothetical protein
MDEIHGSLPFRSGSATLYSHRSTVVVQSALAISIERPIRESKGKRRRSLPLEADPISAISPAAPNSLGRDNG